MSVAHGRDQDRATRPQNLPAPRASLVPSDGTRSSASRPSRDPEDTRREEQQKTQFHAWTRLHEELIACRKTLDTGRLKIELSIYWSILDRVDEGIENFPPAGLHDEVGPLWKILIMPFIYRLLLFVLISGFNGSEMRYNGAEMSGFFKTNAIGLRCFTKASAELFLLRCFFADVFCDMDDWDSLLNALKKWLANDPGSRGTNDIFEKFAPEMNPRMENVKEALCHCLLHVARPLRHTGMGPQDAGPMLCEWMKLNADKIYQRKLEFNRYEELREPDKRSDQACELMKNFYAAAFMETISGDTESEYISRLALLPDDVQRKITQHLGPPSDRESFEKLGLEALWNMLESENPRLPAK